MIIGIGSDLIAVNRIKVLIDKFDNKFINKIFTTNEITQAEEKFDKSDNNQNKKTSFYAKRFAAKEAFVKAVGTGIGQYFSFKDIEISNNKLGRPEIKILNEKENFITKNFLCEKFEIHLTISDEKETAMAFVVIEKIL
jgi:holo-[acyl-carrier protein] synthase